MLKVLIVDDEVLVRIGLKTMISWEEKGYTIIGEASDGREALEIMKSCCPDIVLTDLKMDNMDGFELIKLLKREHPLVKTVVLSCYNDFDNVKEAMKLGASDYIFKLTIKPEELLGVLDSIKEDILKHDGQRQKQTVKSDRIVMKNINAIKAGIIKLAIEKSFATWEDFAREWDELGIKVSLEEEYAILYISIDDYYLLDLSSKIKEKELLKFSIQNIAQEILHKHFSAEIFNYEEGDFIAVIKVASLSQEQIELLLSDSFHNLKELIKRYIGVSISAGLSIGHRGVFSLKEALRKAVQSLKMRFFKGGAGFYTWEQAATSETSSGINEINPDMSKLTDLVEFLDEKGLSVYMHDFIGKIRSSTGMSIEKARSILQEVLYPFVSKARLRGVHIDDIRCDCGFTPYQAVANYDTVDKIQEWFDWFIERYVVESRKKSDSRGREDIIRVKEYIRANIDKEIDVSTAAEYINMSESYFSHLFKKETGTSFVEYVNSVKIEKAKELLLQTGLKIYEIAYRVGFDNANYFSMLFKKSTGVSPNEYRTR